MARPQKSEETAIVELENKFRALPTLKEVGMALMQFAYICGKIATKTAFEYVVVI
jgi:hypothetical protein